MDQNTIPLINGQEPAQAGETGLSVSAPSVETVAKDQSGQESAVQQAVRSIGKPEEVTVPKTPEAKVHPESVLSTHSEKVPHHPDYTGISRQIVQMIDGVPEDTSGFAKQVKQYRVHLTEQFEDKEG